MQMPFTTEQFLNVFRNYNESFPYLPLLTYAAGLAALLLAGRKSRSSNRAILAILGLFWLWNGSAYHLGFFRTINPAAAIFGVLFLLQGVLLVVAAVSARDLRLELSRTFTGVVGASFIAYAMVVYPLLGHLFGHAYPYSPVFGMAPCPTTIFTFGVLLLARRKVPMYLFAIPFLWSVVGFGAAISLQIYEDLGLTVAGLLGTALGLRRAQKLPGHETVERKEGRR